MRIALLTGGLTNAMRHNYLYRIFFSDVLIKTNNFVIVVRDVQLQIYERTFFVIVGWGSAPLCSYTTRATFFPSNGPWATCIQRAIGLSAEHFFPSTDQNYFGSISKRAFLGCLESKSLSLLPSCALNHLPRRFSLPSCATVFVVSHFQP